MTEILEKSGIFIRGKSVNPVICEHHFFSSRLFLFLGNSFEHRRMNCSSCNTALPPEAKFCPECGLPLCRACRLPITPGSRFCMHCGISLGKFVTRPSSRAFSV